MFKYVMSKVSFLTFVAEKFSFVITFEGCPYIDRRNTVYFWNRTLSEGVLENNFCYARACVLLKWNFLSLVKNRNFSAFQNEANVQGRLFWHQMWISFQVMTRRNIQSRAKFSIFLYYDVLTLNWWFENQVLVLK